MTTQLLRTPARSIVVEPTGDTRLLPGRRATPLSTAALASGAIAAPLFFAVALIQAVARDGFDLRDHTLSLLSNGDFGWIQMLNFVATGTVVVAAAIAMRRLGGPARSWRWATTLLATFGAGWVGAGLFSADPAYGFPPGTPAAAPESVSWHGALHLVCGGISFLALTIACFAVARYLKTNGEPTWARSTRIAGVALLFGFAAVGANTGVTNVGFVSATAIAFGFASAISARCATGRIAQPPSSQPAA